MPSSRKKSRSSRLGMTTKTELINGLRNNRDTYWTPYDNRYRPIIVGICLQAGFNREGAEEITQQVLIAFYEAIITGKYLPNKSLRKYMNGIARKKIKKSWKKYARSREGRKKLKEQARLSDVIVDEGLLTRIENTERDKAVRKLCNEILRRRYAKTWIIYQLRVIEDWTAKQVSEHLGISRDRVDKEKHRIGKALEKLRPYVVKYILG